jgi:hypothetical protein
MSTTLELDPRIAARAKAVREQRDFVSAPGARPMLPGDVCNVEPLTSDDYKALLRRLELSCPRLFAELMEADDELWGNDWKDNDARWTLTPHEVRKLNRTRRIAK